MDTKKVTEELNRALVWEFHSTMLYGHHMEFVHGMKHSWLKERMEEEMKESFDHGNKVRSLITFLGGIPTTKLDYPDIKHTADVRRMLQDELKNEKTAAEQYKKILQLVREDSYLYHEVYHLLNSELESASELERILQE